MVSVPSMRSVTMNLAKALFVSPKTQLPRTPEDALRLVVLEKTIRLVNDKGYVLPEDLIEGDSIDCQVVRDTLMHLSELKLLRSVMIMDSCPPKKKMKTKNAWTTSYHSLMDALAEYVDSNDNSNLPTRSYVCKVCNNSTWIPEAIHERVTEEEWKALEAKTRGTPRDLWKCRFCKNASVQLDAIDQLVHGAYETDSSSSSARFHLLIREIDGHFKSANSAKEIAKQDMHMPQPHITVTPSKPSVVPPWFLASAPEEEDVDWEDA